MFRPSSIAALLFCLCALCARAEALYPLVAGLAEQKAELREKAMDALVATGDERLVAFFEQYITGAVVLKDGVPYVAGTAVRSGNGPTLVPLRHAFTGKTYTDRSGAEALVPLNELILLEPNRRERIRARSAAMMVGLLSPQADARRRAVHRAGGGPFQVEAVPVLEKIAAQDPSKDMRRIAKVSLELIRFGTATDPVAKAAAAIELGELRSLRALPLVTEFYDAGPEVPEETMAGLNRALQLMRKRQESVKMFDGLKFGLSSGSIYILIALGLAIVYGLMGVINMAHGEMMMVGAYTTFLVQRAFGHSADSPQNSFFLVALPAAFLFSALVGWVIERLVVRKLYHRPFESLLATVGVSFILIQIIRLIFGDNQACNSPTWLVGSFELAPEMTLAANRVFVFGLTFASVVAVVLLMRFTPFGLRVRATMQNRDMAASVGVDTRRIYSLTFMLGCGLAGLAGAALTTLSGITPDMGQNYIVDSFLVVVVGGVGKLAGVVCSGLGLGVVLQTLENTFFGPVWAKILILTMVVAFIQFRPAGLFPPKGRLADV